MPTNAGMYHADNLMGMVLNVLDLPLPFIGLFPFGNEVHGRIRVLIAPKMYPRILGKTTLYDGRAYTFIGDVVANAITLVRFPNNTFELVVQYGGGHYTFRPGL